VLLQFLGACTKQQPYIVLTELMACSLADAFHWKMFTMNRRRQVCPGMKLDEQWGVF